MTENGAMIGIGVTTLNRRDVFKLTMFDIARYTNTDHRIVVVDDGSDEPLLPSVDWSGIRNEKPQGIAAAKNQCLARLMADPRIEHIFLFDDDCRPTRLDWWKPWVESGLHHLAYLHDNGDPTVVTVYDDGYMHAMDTGTGCMLYFTRECIERVGGMRKEFGRWSFEHLEHSQRIYNAGLTAFPYQGLHTDALWSLDQQEHGHSSIPAAVRRNWYKRNRALWDQFVGSTDFVDYTA